MLVSCVVSAVRLLGGRLRFTWVDLHCQPASAPSRASWVCDVSLQVMVVSAIVASGWFGVGPLVGGISYGRLVSH